MTTYGIMRIHDNPMLSLLHSQPTTRDSGTRGAMLPWTIVLLGLLLGLSASALATDAPDAGAPQETTTASAARVVQTVTINVTAAQAARTARHEFGGKVLGVMLEKNTHAPYYRVRLINSGKVHVVHVNAHQ